MGDSSHSSVEEDRQRSPSAQERVVKPPPVVDLIPVYCPKCGHHFLHKKVVSGKTIGGASGAAAGATLGAQIGIAAGPLGAFAGTIPGAVVGAVVGMWVGSKRDRVSCGRCKTAFRLP
jgi:hypothetical protein